MQLTQQKASFSAGDRYQQLASIIFDNLCVNGTGCHIEEEETLKRALEKKVMVLKLDTTYSFSIWSEAIEKFG